MPWCAHCDRFLSPPTVTADGTCPRCGSVVDAPERVKTQTERDEEELAPVPWHLKLLAVAIAIYLGYRLVQGIEWVVG